MAITLRGCLDSLYPKGDEMSVTVQSSPETDQRIAILNSFLNTPHRKLGEVQPIHAKISADDPIFYRQLAAWYWANGEIRDHKEAFTANLMISKFDGSRDVGLAMLREMPPYQVVRVIEFIMGSIKTTKTYSEADVKAYKAAVSAACKAVKFDKGTSKEAVSALRKAAAATIAKPVPTVTSDRIGMFVNLPRSARTEIIRYLREREADHDWFDSTVLAFRKYVLRLYHLRIKPSDRARSIVFDNVMPDGSRLAALRALSKLKDPIQQARAIIENKISYKVAATVVTEMTPTVILALVEVMSPQDLINNLASLKKRGAFDNPDVKALIDEKLKLAKSSKRVAALKGGEAIKAAGLDEGTKAAVMAVQDAQLKRKGRISIPVALFIDKSQSMNTSIEVGKQIGSMLASISTSSIFTYAFDGMAFPIIPAGPTLDDWVRAFAGITAGGQTCCGVALDYMRRMKQVVEQIVIVTDGGENVNPTFSAAYEKYQKDMGISPAVVMVRVKGDIDRLSAAVKAAKIDMDVWDFNGDYYSLPGLIPLICKTTKLDLLMAVMQTPLPVRRSA